MPSTVRSSTTTSLPCVHCCRSPPPTCVVDEGDVDPLTISITADGKVFLQEEEIDIEVMVARLQAIAASGYDERILVRGDTTSSYGTVMRVMGRLNRAGFKRIGLVTTEES